MQDTCKNRQNTANCIICTNNNENKNLAKTNNKNKCTTTDFNRTKDNKSAKVKGSSMKNNSINNSNLCMAQSRASQFRKMTILSLVILLLGLAFIAFTTYSVLKDSKTATGTIAFTFDSPALCFDNGVEMFYSNIGADGTLNNGGISYGSSSAISLVTDSKYNVTIDDQNQLSQYYVKIEYIFSDLSSTMSLISFDSTSYVFGETSLGAVTADSVLKNRFSLTSTAAVKTGTTFNLFEPLSHFTYTGAEQLVTSSTPQTIYIVVSADTKKDMTDSRAQATIEGQIGFNVVTGSTVSGVSALDNVVIENTYQNGTYQSTTVSGSVSVAVTNPAKYTKITLQSATPLYEEAIVTNQKNGWVYVVTTDENGTTLSARNESTLSSIDVTSVLQNAIVGEFSTVHTNIAYTFSIFSSVDGTTYKSMIDNISKTAATATLKINIINEIKPTYEIRGIIGVKFYVTGFCNANDISVKTDCNLTIDNSTFIKLEISSSLAKDVSITSNTVTVDGVAYLFEATKISSSGYKFAMVSKVKVSSANLTNIFVALLDKLGSDYSSSDSGKATLYYSNGGKDFSLLDDQIAFSIDYSEYTGSPSPCCVTRDTAISTGLYGETMLAEKLQVGNYVLTLDTATNQLSRQKITNVIVVTRDTIATVKLKDGSVLKLTPDHPILTKTGWAVCEGESGYDVSPDVMRETPLQVGDFVKTQTGYVEVESIAIETLREGITVYNFKVENNNNFFASGILLHS